MTRYRSKTIATWLGVCAGGLGAHRFYLYGWRDTVAWIFPAPTLAGLAGLQRMRAFGQDDRVAWALIPLLGLAISAGMLSAIVYALTPDARWDARHNPTGPARSTAWGPVLGAALALLVGGTVLMGTIAFAIQRYFESQG